MAILEPISRDKAKAQLRVYHTDEDELIDDYVSAARRRCEDLTGLTLTIDDALDPAPVIDPAILQAMRTLLECYYVRDPELEVKAEKAVQNILFNARLTILELADEAE